MTRSSTGGLRLSVLITNYNYGRFLDECIASVRSQTRAADQIVVVDDGSTDGSRERLAVEPGVDVVLQEQRGQAGAIDAAVAASDGDLLFLLDADDVFRPHKLERIARIFEQLPDVEWLRHPLELVDTQLQPLGVRVPPVHRSGRIPPHRGMIAERVVTAATSGVVLRRSLAQRVFPLVRAQDDDAPFRLARDADALLLGRIAQAGAHGYTLNEVLTHYRRHEQQMFPKAADLRVLLERQIRVADAIAHELGFTNGNGREPSQSQKHRMILATLDGAPAFAARRSRAWLSGARSIAAALWDRPLAAARQLGALTFAWVAPRSWLRRFHRGQAWSR